MMHKIRVAVMGSTRGSALRPLVEGLAHRSSRAEVVLVLSNKASAGILDRASELSIPSRVVEPSSSNRAEHEMELTHVLRAHHIDVVVLMGYMRILSPYFVSEWKDRVLNVHPSLLPDFAGLMDLSVHQAVIDSKKTETGCTVHLVTEVVDGGRILVQKTCRVEPGDSAETLKARVQALEVPALIDAIEMFGDVALEKA